MQWPPHKSMSCSSASWPNACRHRSVTLEQAYSLNSCSLWQWLAMNTRPFSVSFKHLHGQQHMSAQIDMACHAACGDGTAGGLTSSSPGGSASCRSL